MRARRKDQRPRRSSSAAIVGGFVSGGDGNIAAADTHLQDVAVPPEVVGPPLIRTRLRRKITDVAGTFGDWRSSSMPARRYPYLRF